MSHEAMDFWQLKLGVELLKADDEKLLLSCYGRRHWVNGRGIGRFGPEFLDFARKAPFATSGAAEHLSGFLESEDVEKFLTGLERAGFLSRWRESGDAAREPLALESYFERFTGNRELQYHYAKQVKETELRFVTNLNLPKTWQLESTNWKSLTGGANLLGGEGRLEIVLAAASDHAYLDRINQQALALETPVLCVLLDASGCFLGPIIGPVGQPCLHCLKLRRRSTQKDKLYFDPTHETGGRAELAAWPAHFWRLLAGAVENEVIKLATRYVLPESWLGCQIVDFVNLRTVHERLYRVPGCPICQAERSLLEHQ